MLSGLSKPLKNECTIFTATDNSYDKLAHKATEESNYLERRSSFIKTDFQRRELAE